MKKKIIGNVYGCNGIRLWTETLVSPDEARYSATLEEMRQKLNKAFNNIIKEDNEYWNFNYHTELKEKISASFNDEFEENGFCHTITHRIFTRNKTIDIWHYVTEIQAEL